jgi:hypothetical protein
VAIEASGLSRAFLHLLSAAIEALIDVADPGKGVSGLQQRALDARARAIHLWLILA